MTGLTVLVLFNSCRQQLAGLVEAVARLVQQEHLQDARLMVRHQAGSLANIVLRTTSRAVSGFDRCAANCLAKSSSARQASMRRLSIRWRMAWPRPDSVALAAVREPAYVEASLRGSPPCRWAQLAQPTDLQPQVVGLCEQFPLPFSDVLEAGPRYEYGVLAKSL